MAGIAQEETPTLKMYTLSSKLATSWPSDDTWAWAELQLFLQILQIAGTILIIVHV